MPVRSDFEFVARPSLKAGAFSVEHALSGPGARLGCGCSAAAEAVDRWMTDDRGEERPRAWGWAYCEQETSWCQL